jgi:predicted AAA+ superfamily ATPase
MKTIFDLCQPRADVLGGGIRKSDFAADLALVLRGDAPKEYAEAAVFFANTHPTVGLRNLLANVCRRLSGSGGEASAIFRLDTQYGGRRTRPVRCHAG